MDRVYIETSAILFFVKKDLKENLTNLLKDKTHFISDLVLAEIHNMDEPYREYTARLLEEIGFPVLKLQEEDTEFARKYVYNKVIETKEYSLGLHYYLAAKNNAAIITASNRLIEVKEGLERINNHFKVPIPPEIIKVGEYEDETLKNIRANIGRLVEAQGEKKLTISIRESSEFFIREKKLSLSRREKI